MPNTIQTLSGIVIGLGSIGNRHLNNLQELGLTSLGVVRRSSGVNQHFKVPPGIGLFHSLADALAWKPDFAIVSNPSHLHAETAIQCMEAGTHVLIEKPLGRSIGAKERQLLEIYHSSDLVCAMAYCMRYHAAYRRAHDEIQAGAIGKVLYAKAWFEGYLPDWHPWEDYRQSYAGLLDQGGGVLRTLDHELDFMNWVLGQAESASGKAINTGGIDVQADDLAVYQLHHPNGVMSQITTSFCRKPQSRGFEFIGSSGVLKFCMETGELVRQDPIQQEAQVLHTTNAEHVNQMYRALLLEFLDSCCGQTPLCLASIKDGFNSLSSIESIH